MCARYDDPSMTDRLYASEQDYPREISEAVTLDPYALHRSGRTDDNGQRLESPVCPMCGHRWGLHPRSREDAAMMGCTWSPSWWTVCGCKVLAR